MYKSHLKTLHYCTVCHYATTPGQRGFVTFFQTTITIGFHPHHRIKYFPHEMNGRIDKIGNQRLYFSLLHFIPRLHQFFLQDIVRLLHSMGSDLNRIVALLAVRYSIDESCEVALGYWINWDHSKSTNTVKMLSVFKVMQMLPDSSCFSTKLFGGVGGDICRRRRSGCSNCFS
jgi:hypothetical protein